MRVLLVTAEASRAPRKHCQEMTDDLQMIVDLRLLIVDGRAKMWGPGGFCVEFGGGSYPRSIHTAMRKKSHSAMTGKPY